MGKEYLVYDQDYLEIPTQDLPDDGVTPVVCLDPQKRLGEITWAVLLIRGPYNPDAKGLFWEKDDAILFAHALCE